MEERLLELLVDPVAKRPLRLEADGDTAILRAENGAAYPVKDGIPRFVVTDDPDQRQTEESFAFKWKWREFSDSDRLLGELGDWAARRYGFADVAEMREYFAGRERILDAGCGAGFTSSMWLDDSWQGPEWVGVDISEAIEVAEARLGSIAGTHFVQADVMQLPFRPVFDTVFSEGVLHHTPSTELAMRSAASVLRPGGQILFYVYRRKSPVREFTDDYVRDAISGMKPEEAWEALRPLTRLGQALAELGVEVEVPEDVPVLGIAAGRYDVQRLIYWHFAKLFWNPSFSLEENVHINFDWYHPRYAWRHDPEEVRGWCESAGLEIERFHVEESGITVRATKCAE